MKGISKRRQREMLRERKRGTTNAGASAVEIARLSDKSEAPGSAGGNVRECACVKVCELVKRAARARSRRAESDDEDGCSATEEVWPVGSDATR